VKQKLSLFFLQLALLSSCATIFNGTSQKIPVTTDPPGATVTEEEDSQITPAILDLDKDREYVVTVSMEGYEPQTVKIERVASGWMVLDLLELSPLCLLMDTADGSCYSLKPDHITVSLQPLTQGEMADEKKRVDSEKMKQELDFLERLKESQLLTENEYKALRTLTIHPEPYT
jgi:hypothetical protein